MRVRVLVVGGVVFLLGLGIFLLFLSNAQSMGFWARASGDYDASMRVAAIGFYVAIIGAGIALYGLVRKPSRPKSATSLPTDTPKGDAAFCAYCGKPLIQGAGFCPGCGRSNQK